MSITALTTHYAGRRFRSRTEARWAVLFDALGLRWAYEAEGYALKAGAYLPDFWLPDIGIHFEVKGKEPTEAEIEKLREVSERTGYEALLAPGEPEERAALIYIRLGKVSTARFVLARDVWLQKGFWLVSSDGAGLWLGPDAAVDTAPRGPMFSGSMELAYEAALSADFGKRIPRQQLIAEPFAWRDIEEEAA